MKRLAIVVFCTILLTSLLPLPAHATVANLLQTPVNDEISGATSITASDQAYTQDTTNATTAADDPILPCAVGTPGKQSNTVWYRYTASQTETLVVDTMGSSYNTVLAVWTGTPIALTAAACNDDANGWNTSALSFPAVAGQQYYIEITQFGNPAGGNLSLRLRNSSAIKPVTIQSVDANGNQISSGGQASAISANGRFLVFSSTGSGLPNFTSNGNQQIFMKDLQSGVVSLISKDASGNPGNGTSGLPSISGDGKYVVYQSWATNLESRDTNSLEDIYIFDTHTGVTTLVTVNPNNLGGGGTRAMISTNGNYVVFESSQKLTVEDTTNYRDIFLYNVQNQTIRCLSLSSSQVAGNNNSQRAAISSDGEYVVFDSYATNLAAGDTDSNSDIFLRNTNTNQTTRVSPPSNSDPLLRGNSSSSVVSDDGRFVAFSSSAKNLIPGKIIPGNNVYVRDLLNGTIQWINVDLREFASNNASVQSMALSPDGKNLVIIYGGSDIVGNYESRIFSHNLMSGKTDILTLPSPAGLFNAIILGERKGQDRAGQISPPKHRS